MASKCNWRLEAISNAARSRKKTSFVLKAGENTVGKKKDCDIKVHSVLCSREHCIIYLDGDKVTLKDTSRNGTYITFSKETKHYTNMSTEEPLEQNDMISFGFNTASVYDVNDKNAFIYRLVKEQIETIDIEDSDDEDGAPSPPPTKAKFIEIANKVIDIGSDSDSNYSGDECLQNIEEMEEESSTSSSVMIEDDESYTDDYSESEESIGSEGESFVVTRTILKCATPTETIALDDEDDDEVPDDVHEKPTKSDESNDKVANGTDNKSSTSGKSKKDAKSEDEDTELEEKDAKLEARDVKFTDKVTKSVEKGKPSPENNTNSEIEQKSEEKTENDEKPETAKKSPSESENHAEASTSKTPEQVAKLDRLERLEKLRRKVAEKKQRKIVITKALPVRKRRQTITEAEYNERKQNKKFDIEKQLQLRRQKLADIGERDKKKRTEAAELAAEIAANTIRELPVPKVKVTTVTRAEQLLTDMLALDPTNT